MISSAPFPPEEGIGSHVWSLACYLVQEGHRVQIVTRGWGAGTSHETVDRVTIWRLPFFPLYPFHIHLHGLIVQSTIKRFMHDVDLFHFHTPLPPAIDTDRPVLLTVHSMALTDARIRTIDSFYELLSKLQSSISFLVERRLFRISQMVVAVSDGVATQAQRLLPEYCDCIRIIHNGVDTDVYSPPEDTVGKPDHLLFVGRLDQQKGVDLLVPSMARVLQRFPGSVLNIVGDGPLRGQVLSEIHKGGLARNVRLAGIIRSPEVLARMYSESSVLITPSLYETGPRVILEAMACGTPAIATRVGIASEVIADGINGLLIDEREPRDLADAICRVLGNERFRDSLACEARRTIEQNFSIEGMGNEIVKCYELLLRGG